MPEIREELLTAVTDIVAGQLGRPVDEFGPDTDLRTLEGADSVKVLRIIAKIEQRYDIELEDEDVFAVSTIAEVVTVVDKTLGAEGRR